MKRRADGVLDCFRKKNSREKAYLSNSINMPFLKEGKLLSVHALCIVMERSRSDRSGVMCLKVQENKITYRISYKSCNDM